MTSLRKMALGRLSCSSQSLRRIWVFLVFVVVLLVVMEFHYMWQETDFSAGDTDRVNLQEHLREGYSNGGVDNLDRGFVGKGIHSFRNNGLTPSDSVHGPYSKNGGDKKVDKQEKSDISHRAVSGGLVIEDQHLSLIRRLDIKAHDKWIVLDVKSGPCENGVSIPPGWQVLVSGGTGQLKGCQSPTCIPLRSDSNITHKTVSTEETGLLWKNLAYLTAISHGAHHILDADCSVSLSEAVQVLQRPQHFNDSGLMYNETLLFNPYAHFGAWATVPRALVGEGAVDNSKIYYVRDFDNVLVRHEFSDNSPDAVLRTGLGAAAKSGVRFDPATAPVFLGRRSFSAAVPSCSLYQQNAFWGLLLPCSSHSLRCHVLRHYVTQRLFQELDAFSGFFQTHGASYKTDFSGTKDSSVEVDAEKLASSLDAWKCKHELKFWGCFNLLADYLLETSQIDRHEHSLVKSWVAAVQNVGAVEPVRVESPWRGVPKTSEVRVHIGSMKTRLESEGADGERYVKKHFVDTVQGRCNNMGLVDWFPVAQWKKPVIEDIVLIVVFNTNEFVWNNLPFLETIHRPFFKHIVYCVSDMDELLAGSESDSLRHTTLVEAMSDLWYSMYQCVTAVAQMNFQGVRGYLQIGDDTLLNTWMLFNAPKDSIWMPEGFSTMLAEDITHSWGWYWWPKSRARPAMLHTMADMEHLSGMTSQQILRLDPNFNKTKSSTRRWRSFSDLYSEGKAAFPVMRPRIAGTETWREPSQTEAVNFLTNYYKANRLLGRLKHRAMDFFYIPQVLSEAYIKFSKYFISHSVIIELAVPALHYGLARSSEINYVKAESLWYGNRNTSFSFFKNSTYFLHPFKMKGHMEQDHSRAFFCELFMKSVLSELYKHIKR